MMNRFVKFIDGLPLGVRILINSTFITLPYYISALLTIQIQEVFDITGSYAWNVVLIYILITIAGVFVYHYVETIRKNINLENQSKIRARDQSYSYVDRYVTENLKHFHQSAIKYLSNPASITVEEVFFNSLNNIKALIEKLYSTLESHFTDALELDLDGNRIDFEVTFMTKSYKDDQITIPACSNRENRSPRSMVLRIQKQDNRYMIY